MKGAAYKWPKSRCLSLSAMVSNASSIASGVCLMDKTRSWFKNTNTVVKICPLLFFHQMLFKSVCSLCTGTLVLGSTSDLIASLKGYIFLIRLFSFLTMLFIHLK